MLLEDLMDRRYAQEQTRCSEAHRKGMKPASLGSGAGGITSGRNNSWIDFKKIKTGELYSVEYD